VNKISPAVAFPQRVVSADFLGYTATTLLQLLLPEKRGGLICKMADFHGMMKNMNPI